MRWTILLLTVTFLNVNASSGVAQHITLSGKNLTLKQVFTAIEKQTGFVVFGNQDFLSRATPVSLNVHAILLENFLDMVLKDQPIDYLIREHTKTIILSDKGQQLKADQPPQQLRIHITDTEGEPLPGASVIHRKTGNYGIADAQGLLTMHLSVGDVIVISYVGFVTRYVVIKDNTSDLHISLTLSDNKLEETVIKGYYNTSKRLNTGNVSSIKAEEIAKQPVGDVLMALEGRIPGMVVSQVTGVPGARLNLQIRGRSNFDTNLSSDQPLFIIDGVPVAAGNNKVNATAGPFGGITGDGLSVFSGLNIADIESIDVLKDADATAIYGSRGANGVILITTKKGTSGKMKVNTTIYSGASTMTRMVKMMNTQQYIEMREEAFKNDNITKTNSNAYDLLRWDQNRYTDFVKLLVGNTAHTTDAQLTFSGGDKNTQYRLGGGYHRESTVWVGDKSSDRASMNFNVHNVSDNQKFTMDFSGLYSIGRSDLVAGDLAAAASLPPNYRLYDENGMLSWNEGGGYDARDNPLSLLKLKYQATMNNVNANLVMRYKIFDGLVIKSSFGYNSTGTDDKRLMPIASQNPSKSNVGGLTLFGRTFFKNWIAEPQLEYNSVIGHGKLSMLAGATFNKHGTTGMTARGTGYTGDDLMESLAAAPTLTATTTATQYSYQAFFGRFNYSWQDKYVANFTGRRDGSSRFGPNYRFSNFGAIGAAWIFSNEDFLKKNRILSYGKLRASYGVTGNDQIGEYAYLDSYVSGNTYSDSATLAPGKLFNPNLHWERNTKAELALELGFINDRIQLTASFYQNISSDPLITYPLPRITGFSGVVNNLEGVKIQNRGLELTLTTRNFAGRNFKWSTDFNLTLPNNKLTAYPDIESSSYVSKYAIGRSLNRIFAAQFLGVDPTTGLYTVKDVNGDGKLTSADFGESGITSPQFYGGLNNSFSYKRFSASFFLQFTKQLGKDWRGANTTQLPGTIYNFPTLAMNRWREEGQITDVQKYTTVVGDINGLTRTYPYILSGGAYTDASFIRLKNVYVSYDLPSKWLHVVRFSSCKFYTQAQNLFVLSGYKGGDPETQSYMRMAPLRTITGGLQLTF